MIMELRGHTGGVTQCVFSPDGVRLYSGARKDGAIHCWDVRMSGRILASYHRACPTNQQIGFELIGGASEALMTASQDGCVDHHRRPRPHHSLPHRHSHCHPHCHPHLHRQYLPSPRPQPSPRRVLVYDTSSPSSPPTAILMFGEATNAATTHPHLPLLAVAVGERRYPLQLNEPGVEHSSDDESATGGPGRAWGRHEPEEPTNGLSVWRMPQPDRSPAALLGGNDAASDDAEMHLDVMATENI